MSPKILLAVGLMATASINVMFGFSSSLLVFSILWAINGALQVRPLDCHRRTACYQFPFGDLGGIYKPCLSLMAACLARRDPQSYIKIHHCTACCCVRHHVCANRC